MEFEKKLYPLQTHLERWRRCRPANHRLARPDRLPYEIKPRFARLVRKAIKGTLIPADVNKELIPLDVPHQSALVRAIRDYCAQRFVLENLPQTAK